MSMNEAPSSERLHIGFFGCRNAGKSSLVNAVTGQELSVVSEIAGTTTDAVSKAMELLPLGPVVIIDTPGYDDEGLLGEKRVLRTKRVLNRIDIAVLVVDAAAGLNRFDQELTGIFAAKQIPFILVFSKADLLDGIPSDSDGVVYVSAHSGYGIHTLKEKLGGLKRQDGNGTPLIGDLLSAGDCAVLVCPIDESAPKGRIILPQQQTIRGILDAKAFTVVTKETELKDALERLSMPPKLVITDSQALGAVGPIVPDAVPLTTFSILMARYKGFLETAVAGVTAVERLREGDRILMAEGCTHHRQCNDIGTVKIPRLLQKRCGHSLVFDTCSGKDFPDDLSGYSMVIHCGGCMVTERDIRFRMKCALDQNVPFTNYGIALALLTGTLERTLRCFPEIHAVLSNNNQDGK